MTALCFYQTGTIRYQREFQVNYDGISIGDCGSFNTREEMEKACSADSTCLGYSMFNAERWCVHTDSWCTGDVPEVVRGISYYPWCLKKSKGPRTEDLQNIYYTKIVGSGNLIVYSESVVTFYLHLTI